MNLFTVGYSNLEPEAFLTLLCGAGVTAIADVRSAPYSRRHPHYAIHSLQSLLASRRIAYVFLGKELGGRPESTSLYTEEGYADYEAVRATAAFAEGVRRVQSGLERYHVALMCGEEDPLDCHRGLMLSPALKTLGLSPQHLRKGGRIETMSEFEARLLAEAGLGSLFGECLDEAYRLLNRAKAHRLVDEE